MRIISCILLFCMCSFAVYANDKDDIQELKGKIEKCKKECSDLENKKRKLKVGRLSWEYPFGIPQTKIDEVKAKIDREITEIKGRITEYENSIIKKQESIDNIQLLISKIEIKCKDNFWKVFDNKPDIYLKINGYQICSVQKDTMAFSIAENDVWTDQRDKITFKKSESISIEVWDKDIKHNNRLFTIHIDGKDDKKHVSSETDDFKYRVEWKEK